MGLVVEIIPFGYQIVDGGADIVIAVTESFDAGAKEGVSGGQFPGAFPNDAANNHGVGATQTGEIILGDNFFSGGIEGVNVI